MKKVLLIGALLATSVAQQALAEGAVAVVPAPAGCPKAFQGFHFGGNAGYGFGYAKLHGEGPITIGEGANAEKYLYSFKHNGGLKGFDGGIGVGYTHRVCNWAFRIAFDGNWTGVKGTTNVNLVEQAEENEGDTIINTKIHAKLKNSLQLYGAFGYVIREVAMPFLAFGWDSSKWQASFNDTENNDLNGGGNKRTNSFLWKAGVDLLATRHFVVGMEYTGTAGAKVHGTKPTYNKFAFTAKAVF